MDHLRRDELWADAGSTAWAEIDTAVQAEVARIRMAQMVFPTVQVPDSPNVSVDQFDPKTMTIAEGQTRPFVEISLKFALTGSQVDNEASLRTARALALLAAKTTAQCEDEIFFQGNQAPNFVKNPFPKLLTFTNINSMGRGLLGLINPKQIVPVNPPAPKTAYGSATFDAVVQGIAVLIGLGHPGPFALFLSTEIYADTYQTVAASLTTTADRIRPLVTGGYYGTGSLPAATGLLVSLGGEPTTIYIAQDAVTAFTEGDVDGLYRFRVFERAQIVNRDARALVRLDFK